MTDPEEQALEIQRRWAHARSITLVDEERAFPSRDDALFARSLRPDTLRELEAGDGDELSRLARLRSSSCLAINVFEPWRDQPGPVARVLGGVASTVSFEVKQPTGLRGKAPNLDVLLTGSQPTIGVECKYLEPYGSETNTIGDSYFRKPGLWDGHSDLEALAYRIHTGEERFIRLKAAQFIKHALGLSNNQANDFVLRLVWYRLDHPLAYDIQSEIDQFAGWVTTVDFAAITYQDLVAALAASGDPAPGYSDYLGERYGLIR